MEEKIGLGGGCHWCTEAVFQAIDGVTKVEQGYISPQNDLNSFSEAVIVHFKADRVSLKTLIEIHLKTHASTVTHSFRSKYRSAIYCFDEASSETSKTFLNAINKNKKNPAITEVVLFGEFKPSRESIQNYYKKNPEAPFCERYIVPKLATLKTSGYIKSKVQ